MESSVIIYSSVAKISARMVIPPAQFQYMYVYASEQFKLTQSVNTGRYRRKQSRLCGNNYKEPILLNQYSPKWSSSVIVQTLYTYIHTPSKANPSEKVSTISAICENNKRTGYENFTISQKMPCHLHNNNLENQRKTTCIHDQICEKAQHIIMQLTAQIDCAGYLLNFKSISTTCAYVVTGTLN